MSDEDSVHVRSVLTTPPYMLVGENKPIRDKANVYQQIVALEVALEDADLGVVYDPDSELRDQLQLVRDRIEDGVESFLENIDR